MKKLLSLMILMIGTCHLYSQEIQPETHKPAQTDYQKKSKNQRTAGWILTGTGAGLLSAGLIVGMAEVGEEVIGAIVYPLAGEEPPETHSKGSGALMITGTAMLATGITFLTIAKKNKRKALSMSFINESSQQLRYNMVMNKQVPSIRLRWQF